MNDITLAEYGNFLAALGSQVIEPVVRQVVVGMAANVTADLKSQVPVLTGALRDSVSPYTGAPPVTGGPNQSIERIAVTWEPTHEIGVISALPYSGSVLLGGHSGKFPEGRYDLVIEESTDVQRAIDRGAELTPNGNGTEND